MKKPKIHFRAPRRIVPLGLIALCLSWVTNHSVLWGMLHLILGGWYVLYWILTYSKLPDIIRGWMV